VDKKTSVIIIEDHSIVLQGLIDYFHKTDRFTIAGAVSNLEEAKILLGNVTAEVIILDIQLKDGFGLTLIPLLAFKPVIAVYTAYDDFIHVNSALSKGVHVYMSKHRSVKELDEAITNALNGEKYIDDSVQVKLDLITNAAETLTKRESEIFTLVKNGLSNKRIASQLGIAVRTVENILSCVYNKIGVRSRAELQDL